MLICRHSLLILLFTLIANANVLLENYTYKNPVIYSNDLSDECDKKFEVIRIDSDKTSFRVNAQVIAKTFELNGCNIETQDVRFVNFIKQSDINLTSLEQQVATLFMDYYPTLKINQVHLYPRGFIESLPESAKAMFDQNSLFKNKGTFYITEKSGIRRYFDFWIDGAITLLHTRGKALRKEPLNASNTVLKTVPFTSFRDKPLGELPINMQRFRATLKENTPILSRNIEPMPVVQKGTKVNVQVKNGSVIIEFIATAIQEGALYDIITIEKADKKRVRAKIIGNNSVELL